jgi:hypothetical protein
VGVPYELGWKSLLRVDKAVEIMESHPAIFSIFCGWNAVTITYFVIKVAVTSNPFFDSALNLVIELCLMYVMFNFSVLLRMKSDQLIPTILAYMPTVALSAIIFVFRLLLVDINVVLLQLSLPRGAQTLGEGRRGLPTLVDAVYVQVVIQADVVDFGAVGVHVGVCPRLQHQRVV